MPEILSPDILFSSLESEIQEEKFPEIQFKVKNNMVFLCFGEGRERENKAPLPSAGDSGRYFASRYFYLKQ